MRKKIFNISEISKNEYSLEFIFSKQTEKYFQKYTEMVSSVKGIRYDPEMDKWIIPKNIISYFTDYEDSINATPTKQESSKAAKKAKTDILVQEKKVITGYENIGNTMKLKPYDYQKEIIKFILDNKEVLVVSPCGSGKTPIGISTFDELIRNNKIKKPGVFVVKASLKVQWAAEVKKFTDYVPSVIKTYKEYTSKYANKIKNLEKKLLTTVTAKDKQKLEKDIKELRKKMDEIFSSQFENCDILILNYETLLDPQVKKKLHKIKPEYIFADEIHYVKSDTIKRSKALCEFNEAEYKVGATATPVQRDPRDLYGIFKFVNPSLFPKKGEFGQLYVKWGSYGRAIGSKNEKLLNNKISPYMIIKTKEEVSKHLPKLVVTQRYCQLEPKQEEMMNRIFEELEDLKNQEKALEAKLSPSELTSNEEYLRIEAGILARQTFAQELADSELLLSDSDSDMAKNYVTKSNDNKLDLLIELVSEIIESGEKVCIFSKFKRMQDIITDRIHKEKDLKDIKIAYVNGSIKGEDRYNEIYTKFRDNDEYKVLIASDAMAEGANLEACKYLIEYDLADSYAIQTQRHGRIERASSVHDVVFVYQLIAENSWDEIALKIVEKKERYDSVIIKGNES